MWGQRSSCSFLQCLLISSFLEVRHSTILYWSHSFVLHMYIIIFVLFCSTNTACIASKTVPLHPLVFPPSPSPFPSPVPSTVLLKNYANDYVTGSPKFHTLLNRAWEQDKILQSLYTFKLLLSCETHALLFTNTWVICYTQGFYVWSEGWYLCLGMSDINFRVVS